MSVIGNTFKKIFDTIGLKTPTAKDIEGISLPGFSITYKDPLDLKAFYKAVHEWLAEYDWIDLELGKCDGHESLYIEKDTGVKEHWAFWSVYKIPVDNNFVRWRLDIVFHTLAVAKTEIMVNGKKKKLDKGEMEIKFSKVLMELDYKKEWSKNSFLAFFYYYFPKIFYREYIKNRKKEFFKEVLMLKGLIKNWLSMKVFMEPATREQIYEPKSFPS